MTPKTKAILQSFLQTAAKIADEDKRKGFPFIVWRTGLRHSREDISEHIQKQLLTHKEQHSKCGQIDTPYYKGCTAPTSYCVTQKHDECESEYGKYNQENHYHHQDSKGPAETYRETGNYILLEIICPQPEKLPDC